MPSPAAKRFALPLTLFVLAVYLALLPWTGQVWLRTGDEPHYLVAANSLVRDGDFDLRNNYVPGVYLDWYPSANLAPQIKPRADGAEYLAHTYGLSLLIAPAYWLAGARGVAYFMALLGALLAGQVYLLCLQVTGDWRASTLGALVVALAPPMIWYVYLLYPELAGALCVTVAVRVVIDLTPLPLREGGPGIGANLRSRPLALIPPTPFPRWGKGEKTRNSGGSRHAKHAWNHLNFGINGERIAKFAPMGGPGGAGHQLLLGLALAALPWLSARFIPAALVLAALAILRLAWLKHASALNSAPGLRSFSSFVPRPSSFVSLLLLAVSLAALSLFNHALYGQAAATASYNVDVSPGPVDLGMLLQVTRGTLGWLLDHQRGLLVAGPVYFLAFIGLGQWLWRRQWAALVVALPFAAALGSTALVGGFWIGIEPAARYLVYVLPPLGAALAYAWVHRRGPWLAALTTVSLVFGLWTAVQVFQQPLLAQTHDLIGERLPGLVPFLPALGKPTFLAPGSGGELAVPVAAAPGQPSLWQVPAGAAGSALQQPAIVDLPFGWYTLQFDLGARGAAADAPVARVLFQAGDHTPLLDTMLYGRDFAPGGQLRHFAFPVFNHVYNEWEQPAGLWIFTTGQAELTLGAISLPPDTFHSLVVPGLWLALLVVVGILVGRQYQAGGGPIAKTGAGTAPLRIHRARLMAVAVGALLVVGVGIWSLRPVGRQFPVKDLSNLIGSRVADAAAGSQVITTAGDEETPGALAQSAPAFWPAGHYRWTLSLKAGDALDPNTALATVTIRAPRQAVPGFPASVAAGSVPADGRFHTLAVEFDNPVRQALVFELDATGAGALQSQGFEVNPTP